MMIDFALEAERERGQAAATRRSTRPACCASGPIMMTTMAALLGGVPLALGTGTGSELRRPLGITIVGGLICQPDAHALHHAGDLSRSSTGSATRACSGGAPAPATPRRRCRRIGMSLSDAVHPAPGRDDAADRRRSRWPACVAYRLLPVAPLPQVDFPTIQVSARPARRQPGDDGLRPSRRRSSASSAASPASPR